jgi:hypothetical protein
MSAAVTSFAALDKAHIRGRNGVGEPLSAFWDSTTDQLFEVPDSAEAATIYAHPSAGPGWVCFHRPAWVKGSIDVRAASSGEVLQSRRDARNR